MPKIVLKIACFIILFSFTACNTPPPPAPNPEQTRPAGSTPAVTEEIPAPTATLQPPQALTICLGQEPSSLFLYGDASPSARAVRQAVYDGPFDSQNFALKPVILADIPNLNNGGAALRPVEVAPNAEIVDSQGQLTNLTPGVTYLPSGCQEAACAKTYQAGDPVSMDELAVQFKLRPGLTWSDGAPLGADDSLYSFEVARSLYPRARADLLARTQAYNVLDLQTVEWVGLPGFNDARYASNFFSPLPRHAWGTLKAEDLLSSDLSNRMPLGWGAYQIDEWTPGDHISLSRNPAYFRAAEGLPHFDRLVFRFMPDAQEALVALQAGECDYLDESLGLESQAGNLVELQNAGRAQVFFNSSAAWEHADFGVQLLNPDHPALFASKETRQAVAQCIDRQKMAQELFFGQSQVPDSYVPPMHPFYNPDVKRYAFDPQAAASLLDGVGWRDTDGDPTTPRVAQSVAGVPDGTPFQFTYLTTEEPEKQKAAEIVKSSLAQCGVLVEVRSLPWQDLLSPGPDGPVFGRSFDMAQYGWVTSLEPPCFLYTSAEIPGPYPEYPKGWGGSNATGYSSPEFDQACALALNSLPDDPRHLEAHRQAQAIFAEDLPSLPLYLRLKLAVAQPGLCNVTIDPSADSALWNLEAFDKGESCGK